MAASYRPIRDYAAIGDCHGSALAPGEGSIDWCCLERFDADPVFCRILDAGRGGFLAVRLEEPFTVRRACVEGTNILQTTFTTASGVATLTDFMPVGRRPGAGTHDYVSLNAPGWLVRRIEGKQGRVALGRIPSVRRFRSQAGPPRSGAGRCCSRGGPPASITTCSICTSWTMRRAPAWKSPPARSGCSLLPPARRKSQAHRSRLLSKSLKARRRTPQSDNRPIKSKPIQIMTLSMPP